jgi:hypothetical protein
MKENQPEMAPKNVKYFKNDIDPIRRRIANILEREKVNIVSWMAELEEDSRKELLETLKLLNSFVSKLLAIDGKK